MSPIRDNYQFTYISTNTTTQINNSLPTRLIRIVVGTTAAGSISIYNNISSDTSNPIATLKSSIVENSYEFGVMCSVGLKIVTAASSLITVVWAVN